MTFHNYRPGQIAAHQRETPRRARVPWFCSSFVAMLCAVAFIAGVAVGIIVTLRIVANTAPPKPEVRATVQPREMEELVSPEQNEIISI